MMDDLFLRVDGVRDENEAIDAAINSALQRNKVYETDDDLVRAVFCKEWRRLIEAESLPYRSQTFSQSDQAHCDAIERIASTLTSQFGRELNGGKVRFATSQKAFNLYLKYLWKMKKAAVPPHCPIDSVVLAKAGITGQWTKCDSRQEYMGWVQAIRMKLTMAEWENEVWLRWRLTGLT